MKKFICLLIIIIASFSLYGCNADEIKNDDTNNNTKENENVKEDTTNNTFEGSHKISIEVEDYGTINVELDENSAPITVKNFLELTEKGFYDGLTFHRIISGFMIQGGYPLGNGTGGADVDIKGEFTDNGVDNKLSHTRGAISMARALDYDTASSQFFIVHEDSLFLDGQYAVFGYVTEGMELVDKICEDIQVEDSNGTVKPKNQPLIKSIKIIE